MSINVAERLSLRDQILSLLKSHESTSDGRFVLNRNLEFGEIDTEIADILESKVM
ncbi:MAG: hypothetical protein R3C03_16440 [Pirellulaceae bacterium]